MKVLCIGDQHIKLDNISEFEKILSHLSIFLKTHPVDFIISMGDLLHTHERLHILPFNKAIEYIELLSSFAKTFILIGNHDYINCSQFLTKNHWLGCLRHFPNVVVVDTPLVYNNVAMCPFVPDGKFVKALDTIDKWKESKCVFGHQMLNGCSMNSRTIFGVEEWKREYPFLVCGHIHEKQRLENIYYVGSLYQENFGESIDKTISILEFDESNKLPTINEFSLNLPIKKTIKVDVDKIDGLDLDTRDIKYKIIIIGKEEELKLFKHTQKYKELSDKAKIHFEIYDILKKNDKKEIEDKPSFYSLLYNIVYNGNDMNLISLFNEYMTPISK
jgi:DNA repair exonuclease SbcCD nuclease subunit